MARQEQDFSKETNRQSTILFIKDSEGVTIDLIETQCSQVLQSLLTLSDLQRRLKSLNQPGGRGPNLLRHPCGCPMARCRTSRSTRCCKGSRSTLRTART